MITVFTYSAPIFVAGSADGLSVGAQLASFQNGCYGLLMDYRMVDVHTHDSTLDSLAIRPIDGLSGRADADIDIPTLGGADAYRTGLWQLSNGNFLGLGGGYDADTGPFANLRILHQNGTAAGPAFSLPESMNSIDSLTCLALPGGGFILSWDHYDPTQPSLNTDVDWQIFDNAGHTVGDLHTIGGSDWQGHGVGTILTNGNLVECWMEGPSRTAVRAQVFDLQGHSLSVVLDVSGADGGYLSWNSVIALTNGNFVVTWREDAGGPDTAQTTTIYARIYNSSGVAIGKTITIDQATATDNAFELVWEPTTIALPDGRFAMSWSANQAIGDGSYRDYAQFQVFEANGTPASPLYSLGENDGTQSHPNIMALPDGRIAATWTQPDGAGGYELVTQILDPRDHGIDLAGNALADTYVGSVYQDRILGMNGNDVIDGWSGKDLLNGGFGADRLFGGEGNDILQGAVGNDTLNGYNGSDRLNGGKGNDMLTSGSGLDVFIFAPGDGKDTISAFVDGQDRIDLTAYHFATFAGAKSHFAATADGVRFTMGADTVLIHGLTMAQLTVGDLILV